MVDIKKIKTILLALLLCLTEIPAEDSNATINFFFGTNLDTKISYQLGKAVAVLKHPKFNRKKPIMLYSHGYGSSSDSVSSQAIVKAYIENGNYNIFLIDWRELASGLYTFVASSLEELGCAIATFVLQLINQQIATDKIHLVGFSLGGHLVGSIGRCVISQSKGKQKLKRISGLDPAGPYFYDQRFNITPISKNVAFFVDIIHTDAGVLGTSVSTGTVDFWPNGGKPVQPGCLLKLSFKCSHERAVYLWAESIQYKSKASFTSTQKNSTVKIQMGNNCILTAPPGDYYLKTNEGPPYSKG